MSAKDYLWEKRGEPDEQTRELEALLGQARFSGMELPKAKPRRRWPLGLAVLAAAAGVVMMLVPREGFVLLQLGGAERKLYRSQWLETGTGENATLQLGASIGRVEVAEGSRVRVTRLDKQEQRLELARGSVHATVDAPPRLFVIDTPSATAVDLGCEYVLRVDGAGASRLEVLSGRVELAGRGRSSVVPAGMWSVTLPGQAPGVPVDRLATPALVSAVERLEQDGSVLPLLLRQAEGRDAVTLWHLLARTEGDARVAVFARLMDLVPMTFDQAAALRLEPAALDAWWTACLSAREETVR
jgi:hypothetical protein